MANIFSLADRFKADSEVKNAKATKRAAVIDDMPNTNPPEPRGIKIHSKARIAQAERYLGPGEYIEVIPERYWSWGVEAPAPWRNSLGRQFGLMKCKGIHAGRCPHASRLPPSCI